MQASLHSLSLVGSLARRDQNGAANSFVNGRKHLVSFFNLLDLKLIPQFGTLFGANFSIASWIT